MSEQKANAFGFLVAVLDHAHYPPLDLDRKDPRVATSADRVEAGGKLPRIFTEASGADEARYLLGSFLSCQRQSLSNSTSHHLALTRKQPRR